MGRGTKVPHEGGANPRQRGRTKKNYKSIQQPAIQKDVPASRKTKGKKKLCIPYVSSAKEEPLLGRGGKRWGKTIETKQKNLRRAKKNARCRSPTQGNAVRPKKFDRKPGRPQLSGERETGWKKAKKGKKTTENGKERRKRVLRLKTGKNNERGQSIGRVGGTGRVASA